MNSGQRAFLLSPAFCGGRRAMLLLNGRGTFPLAAQLRDDAAPLGEVFAFLSGLYFRGKLAYARAFSSGHSSSIGVITPTRGLMCPETPVSLELLREFAEGDVDPTNSGYRVPLERDAHVLRTRLGKSADIVLLGSIASEKYVDVLGAVFGQQLRFPCSFVGRGDMSRGALMLRAVRESRELDYTCVLGAIRRGPRAPKLADTN
jgi:hypothetical protein